MTGKEHWKPEPDDHDYPAAASYLSLLMPGPSVDALVAELRAAPIGHWKAKDLLRASGLALLSSENPHVASDLKKVKDGERLSPVLLVRGSINKSAPLQIADGYHRICASYHLDENTDIPCRMAGDPTA
ncbi:MAG: hypothetical protein ABSA65_08775 [Acidimicrobiales bacterium]